MLLKMLNKNLDYGRDFLPITTVQKRHILQKKKKGNIWRGTLDAFLVGGITIGIGQADRATVCLPFHICSQVTLRYHPIFPFPLLSSYFRFWDTGRFTLKPRSHLSITANTSYNS